jgi:hypothetical protein
MVLILAAEKIGRGGTPFLLGVLAILGDWWWLFVVSLW